MGRRYLLLALSALAVIVSILLAIVVNVATGRPVAFLSDLPPYVIWLLVGGLAVVATGLAVGQVVLPQTERRPDSMLDQRLAVLLRSLGEASSSLAATPAAAVPSRSLPPPIGRLIGREKEVAAIKNAVAKARAGGGVAVIALSGKPGVGKTALALHAAHRLGPDFPDGHVYVEVGGMGPAPLGAAEILDCVLTQVAPEVSELPAAVNARIARLRLLLADRRTLLLLDDVAAEGQVRPCLAGGAGTTIMLTGRRPLDGLDLTLSLNIQTLPRVESTEMIMEVAGRRRRKREQDSLNRLAGLCGDLPLALRIAGALMRSPSWPLDLLCESLAVERDRLDLLKIGDIEVRASIALSYRQLDAVSKMMFRRIGLLKTTTISPKTAGALCERDESVARNVLLHLVDAQLVDSDGPERYSMHDLVRLYAAERADHEEGEQDRRAAVGRAIAAVAQQAWSTAISLDPTIGAWSPVHIDAKRSQNTIEPRNRGLPKRTSSAADLRSASTWFANSHESLVSLARQAFDIGEFASVITITMSLHPYLVGTGRLEGSLTVAEMALRAARNMNDGAAIAFAEAATGTALVRMGRPEEAIPVLDRAAEACRATGNLVGEGRALAFLGHAFRDSRDFVRAQQSYQAALSPLTGAGLSTEAAGVSSDLGQILREVGQLAAASRMMERALQLAAETEGESLRVTRTRAWAYENLGSVRKRQGQFDKAVECHLAAAAEFGRLEDPVGLAFSLRNLGDLAFAEGMRDHARRAYEMSRDRFAESGNRIGVSQAEASLALLHIRSWRPRVALRSIRVSATSRGIKYTALRMLMLAYLVWITGPRAHRRALNTWIDF